MIWVRRTLDYIANYITVQTQDQGFEAYSKYVDWY